MKDIASKIIALVIALIIVAGKIKRIYLSFILLSLKGISGRASLCQHMHFVNDFFHFRQNLGTLSMVFFNVTAIESFCQPALMAIWSDCQ